MNSLGKIPPQQVELEELVLGAVMLENCINEVSDILSVQSFYKDANSRIFNACLTLHKE